MAKFLDGNGLGHLWDIIKEHVSTAVATAKATIDAYTINGKKISSNPTLSKGDLGLGNVTNDAQVKRTEMGKANGVATLDSGGKVPSAQLPSYVDDVLEYAQKSSFPATGESGKIYVSTNDNKTWRWSGTTYVEISQGVTLGETSSTAFRGDQGKVAYAHATAKGSAFSSGLYKITTNGEGHVTAAVAVTKTDITNLGIPAQDTKYTLPQATSGALGGVKIGYTTSGKNYAVQLDANGRMFVNVNWTDTNTTYGVATTSANGLMSAADKKKVDSLPGQIVNTIGILTGYQNDNYGIYLNISNYSFTNGSYQIQSGKAIQIPLAVSGTNPHHGLMSTSDKAKLDGIATGATADSALSTSEIDSVCV